MPGPLTFGVEMEFCVEWVYKPQPKHEQKIVVFPRTRKEQEMVEKATMTDRITNHIFKTIADNGFKIDVDHPRKNNTKNWEVTLDLSIMAPGYLDSDDEEEIREELKIDDEGGIKYNYQGIEVVSPAFPFNEDSLLEVEKMCRILNETYRLSVNKSTGLHVHLGHGNQGFKLKDLKELAIFLYTFEPQLSSLHPLNRYNHHYGSALRHSSIFTVNFQKKYNRIPKASEFAASINSCKKRATWLSLTKTTAHGARDCNYNFVGVSSAAHKDGFIRAKDPKQTIEFCQHKGTTYGKGITHWVGTIAGIVSYAENTPPPDRHNLMSTIWAAEKWEKMGDGSDEKRAAELGPALADEGFTIIDLLKHLELDGQAEYYKDRWHKHEIRRRPTFLGSDITWDFQQIGSGINPSSTVYKRENDLAQHFDALRLHARAERLVGEEVPQIDLSLFPAHTIHPGQESDDPDEESDHER